MCHDNHTWWPLSTLSTHVHFLFILLFLLFLFILFFLILFILSNLYTLPDVPHPHCHGTCQLHCWSKSWDCECICESL